MTDGDTNDSAIGRQREISAALARVSADLWAGAHYPTAALIRAQIAALRYLVDQTPQRVQTWRPRNGNLGRDELLAKLQAAFYASPSGPAAMPETLPGAQGERLDVSRPGGPGWGYRSGVTDALTWLLSRLSVLDIDKSNGEVVRFQGWA